MGYKINTEDHPAIIRKIRELNRLSSELYRLTNRKTWNDYFSGYYRNKLKSDPAFKNAHYARTFLSSTKKCMSQGREIGKRKGCKFIKELAIHINQLMEIYKTTTETMVADGWTFDHLIPCSTLAQLLVKNGVTSRRECNKIINDPANVDLKKRARNIEKHDKLIESYLPVAKKLLAKYPQELAGLLEVLKQEIEK